MLWMKAMLLVLYALWVVIIGLTVKLLITRKAWRHPLQGNGPMLWALIVALIGTEIARAQNIGQPPPPHLTSLACVWIETLLILYWLYRQLELIPRWIRQHLQARRERRQENEHAHDRGPGAARQR